MRAAWLLVTGFVAFDVGACTLLTSKDGLTGGGGAATGMGGTASGGGGSSATGGGGQSPSEPRSCDNLADNCGADGTANCCLTLEVAGGDFSMGEGGTAPEGPEHDVSVPPFRLDAFEVTVGRFRNFVGAVGGGWRPQNGDGANPSVPNSGWQDAWWDQHLEAGLLRDAGANAQTWSEAPADYELYPINMVPWYAAFAFCAWDRGWLPTEAEWEFAAAGGSDDSPYPWGDVPPASDLAFYGGAGGGIPDPTLADVLGPVGSWPAGASSFGQLDLAGSMAEWTMDAWDDDWYATQAGAGGFGHFVNLTAATSHTMRGGSWARPESDLRASFRWGVPDPVDGDWITDVGFRCARAPIAE